MGRIELDDAGWENGRGYRKNRLVDAAMLACPGALVQLVEMAPGDIIPDHVHQTSFEFYTVLAGACCLVLNEETHTLKAGDMFLTQPGDVHRLYNDGAVPFRLLVFKTNASPQDTFWVEDTRNEQRHS